MRKLLAILLPSLALLVAMPLQSAGASTDGRTLAQLRDAHDLAAARDYATALGSFAEAWQQRRTCPVPGSTFVDSWHAPRSGHLHIGTDMMAPDGTPIVAVQSGVYRQHGAESFYLDGDDGTQWFGTHLQEHVAADGQRVNAGDLIALVGHSGNASPDGPHLHLELHPGGGEAAPSYAVLAQLCQGQAAQPEAVTAAPERVYYAAPDPTFPFRVHAVHRWFNSTRPVSERIDHRAAVTLTHYLNGLVARYLRAVMAHSCSDPSSCAAMVRSLAPRYGVDPEGAVRVMMCESGGNPTASNGGRYLGLFQQAASYWASRASTYGHPGASAFDGYANADVSLQMVRDGGWGPWECRP